VNALEQNMFRYQMHRDIRTSLLSVFCLHDSNCREDCTKYSWI